MYQGITSPRTLGKVQSIPSPKWATMNIRYWWLLVISVLLRWLPFVFLTTSMLVDFKRVCIVLSYTLLLFALLRNARLRGVRIVTFGTFSNFVAILANRGFMPVSPDARYLAGKTLVKMSSVGITLTGSGGVVLPIDQTRLWFLTDIIPVSSVRTVFSIGDFVIGVGILVACASLISLAVRTMHTHVPDFSTKE